MRKILFLALIAFYIVLPKKVHAQEKSAGVSANMIAAANLPEAKKDTRVETLSRFLNSYDSPLAGYADVFVSEADANNIDWRLVASISGVESTFGKFLPQDSYNAWGWGIYGDHMTRFTSYEDAIKTISKGLGENYVKKLGTNDVYAIGRMYAASPTWASRVTFFMARVDGFENTTDPSTLSLSL